MRMQQEKIPLRLSRIYAVIIAIIPAAVRSAFMYSTGNIPRNRIQIPVQLQGRIAKAIIGVNNFASNGIGEI